MSRQLAFDTKEKKAIDPVETYEFEPVPPIQGYPELRWNGKSPFLSTQYYPAQIKEIHGERMDGWLNEIYWGDNLQVMSHLLKKYRGKVSLAYIDPPFDSKADYKKKIELKGKSVGSDYSAFEEKQYTDIWSRDEYLQFMYERLILLKELLSDKGVLFVHLDPNKVHYIKIILDGIFGEENFRNEIIWRNNNAHNSATTQFGPIHQNILFYSKSSSFQLTPGRRPFTAGYIKERFKYEDKRGIYQPNYLTGPGIRSGESGHPWRGFNPTSNGRHWAIPKAIKSFLPNEGKGLSVITLLDALLGEDLILLPKKKGGQPMYKQYMTDGIHYQDLWCYQPNTQGVLYNSDECIDEDVKWLEQEEEAIGYPTQKPEGLLHRIMQSCSSAGDIIFDCFMGAGTTQAVAMKLGRRFIGCDINLGAIQITTRRLLQLASELNHQNGHQNTKPQKCYTGFSVYNVNNYDIFRNPPQAKDLLKEALEINPFDHNSIYDGEKDGRMVKIMPVNRIATRADLNELITGFDQKTFEKRKEAHPNKPVEKLLLVCMGHEPDLAAHLEKEVQEMGFKIDVEVVDILRDKANLEFKRDSEAKIKIKKGQLVIENFYPLNLLQKLSLLKENVEDWRELVESVMIDWNYDGTVFKPAIVDVPEKNKLVVGSYDVPENAGTIRVKITDLLSESLEVEVQND